MYLLNIISNAFYKRVNLKVLLLNIVCDKRPAPTYIISFRYVNKGIKYMRIKICTDSCCVRPKCEKYKIIKQKIV